LRGTVGCSRLPAARLCITFGAFLTNQDDRGYWRTRTNLRRNIDTENQRGHRERSTQLLTLPARNATKSWLRALETGIDRPRRRATRTLKAYKEIAKKFPKLELS